MCCSSGSSSTSAANLPAWLQTGAQQAVGDAMALDKTPYAPYAGDRVAGANADQANAYSRIKYLANEDPGIRAEAWGDMRQYGAAPAQSVSTQSSVDPHGPLGPISGYVNPYVDQTLTPTIRNINEQAQQQRQQIGSQAISAGAYGDARQGVREGEVDRNADTAIGDATGQAYGNAYNAAMANRQNDLSRFLQSGTTNANLGETATNRLGTAATGLENIQTTSQQNALARYAALLSAGTQQQQTAQNQLDANYQAYQDHRNYRFDKLGALVGAVTGSPYSRGTTTQTTSPDNSGLGALGSLLGAAFHV